jgi:uncharacterized protein
VSAARAEPLELAGPAGRLEALFETPVAGASRGVALLCHPHPLHGGSLTNKVVHTLGRAFQERGYATLKFNFRGVGLSSGGFDEGRGETEDALAAFDYARARVNTGEAAVAGFSFGAYVAYRVALVRELARLVSIAPPVARFGLDFAAVPKAPWLIVQGSADEVVEPESVRAFVASLQPPPRLIWMEGASHFFHGRLIELKEALEASLPAG